jgi:hypothetical protein
MKIKMMLAVVVALLLVSFSSVAAYADTLNFTLTSPNPTFESPGTYAFEATVSAPLSNGGNLYLNGDSYNVTGPLGIDDSDFFLNAPLDLAPGDSFTGDLFEVIVPPGTLDGTYAGTFSILGGADGGASNVLGTVSFAATVPEPSSIVLLLSGVAGLGWFGSKRSFRGLVR